MAKIFCFFILLLCVSFFDIREVNAATIIEVRGDALIPAKHRFRKVYGTCCASFGVEASRDICNCLDVWANFDQLNKEKHVSSCGRSRINLSTGSIGLKKICNFNNCFKGYLGLGISVAGISIRNKLIKGSTHSHKNSVGGVVKSGVYIFTTKNIFLDCFIDYCYQPVHYHHTTNCGGTRIGMGLGIALPFN